MYKTTTCGGVFEPCKSLAFPRGKSVFVYSVKVLLWVPAVYKNLKTTYSYGKILYILNPLPDWGESYAA